jgi:hypothetical protein
VPDAAAVAGGVLEGDPALRVAAHLQAPPCAGDLSIATMAEHFADTEYGQYFLQPGELDVAAEAGR